MPKQIQSEYEEPRIPFTKMTYSPDVPSSALGPNEYNVGLNIETDVRGIRSVAGDIEILDTVPGTPTFISGGFRQNGAFWFIVATVEGYWYAASESQTWYDITPGATPFTGYTQSTNITEAWNGTVPFFNDSLNPPMFLPDEKDAILVQYSGIIKPATIDTLTVNVDTVTATFGVAYATTPYIVGQKIVVSGVSTYFDGTYTVVNCTPSDVEYSSVPGAAVPTPIPSNATISPAYTWNYTSTWKNYYANFMRLYSTPNVGSILVAGNLTATTNTNPILVTGDTTTGVATLVTIDALNAYIGKDISGDGIQNGTTIIGCDPGVSLTLSKPPLTTEVAATFTLNDVQLFPVTIQWSQAFGLNQAPSTWTPTVTNVANQLEVPLRGPALDGFPCNGQFFLCSYWDTVVFSPLNYSTTSAPILGVRLFNQGRGLLSSNCWANTDKLVYGVDARDIWVFDGTDFQGLGNQRVKNWFYDQLDPQYYAQVFMEVNSQKNQIEIYYYVDDQENPSPVPGVPNRMLSYRYDIDVWNAPRTVSNATFACESPIYTNSFNLGSRTVVYARGESSKKLVQKDYGYTDADGNPITSYFRRDNIKLLKDYSGKLMVHRILPEVNNLGGVPFTGDYNKPIDPSTSTNKGNVTITIEGATSVGSPPTSKVPVEMSVDTESPWCQIDQNAFRVNSIEISNTSNNSIWLTSAVSWQITQVEDDR